MFRLAGSMGDSMLPAVGNVDKYSDLRHFGISQHFPEALGVV